MKTTVTKTEFRDTFHHMGRGDNFSYDGLGALFDWLEEDTRDEMEFDCVALCCEFSEYESAKDCAIDYLSDAEYQLAWDTRESDEDDKEDTALEWLCDNTLVIEFEGGIIIQQF
jgi:hypothetical protein|tara:strand:+ start:1847 stop:2188 length:342 start_codon:yes stop_codon:yes gene_type:complete